MFYVISLSIGIALLILSLFMLNNSLTFVKKAERTTAIVTKLETVEGGEGVTYRPVFTFTTKRNEQIIYRRSGSSSPAGWEIGEKTSLAYDPAQPSDVRILTYFGTFGWSIILMSLSMPLIIIGGGYYIAQYYFRSL